MTMKHNIYLGGRKEREHPGLKEVCATMTTNPHPLRCETCNHYEPPPNLRGYFGYCNIDTEISMELTEIEISIHKKMGCASHSASSDKVLEEIEAGISAYVKEHEHQQAKDNKGIYIPVNVVRRLIKVRKKELRLVD
jgi:hypothetical protein